MDTSPSKRASLDDPTDHLPVVVFDVCGKRFKVRRQTIECHPGTLLANLLDDISTDCTQPIYVDASPDRFPYILDWYRHGEIHAPPGIPAEALINDARFFLLPDSIRINGAERLLHPHTDSYPSVHRTIIEAVIAKWPTFDQYIEMLVKSVREHFESIAEKSIQSDFVMQNEDREVPKALLSQFAFPPKSFTLRSGTDWTDNMNVCNVQRLWVTVDALEKRGFKCKVFLGSLYSSENVRVQVFWHDSG